VSRYERAGWFRLDIPEGWIPAEDPDGTLALSRADGAGELRISVREGPRGGAAGQRVDPYLMLRAFSAQTGVDFELASPRRWSAGGLDWAVCEWTADEDGESVAWRAWMATNQDLLVFATYASAEDDKELERGDVDALLARLELA
jgi:hypothetical protein